MCARVRPAVTPGAVDRSGGAPISELVGITAELCMTALRVIKALAAQEVLDTEARRILTQRERELFFAKPVYGDENCGSRTVKNS